MRLILKDYIETLKEEIELETLLENILIMNDFKDIAAGRNVRIFILGSPAGERRKKRRICEAPFRGLFYPAGRADLSGGGRRDLHRDREKRGPEAGDSGSGPRGVQRVPLGYKASPRAGVCEGGRMVLYPQSDRYPCSDKDRTDGGGAAGGGF